MSEEVKKAAEEVSDMAETLKAMQAKNDAKLEEILKEQARLNKAMIRSNEDEKDVGKGYGFLQAKSEVARGKTASAPYWDAKTTQRYNEYIKMVYDKDFNGIKKAFADGLQDGVSTNWTPTEFRSEIIRLAFVNSIALQKCTIVPMGRDKIDMPAPTGGYTVSWVDAGATVDSSKFTAGKVNLTAEKLMGIALINKEDLDDSAFPLAPFVAAQMGEDFGKKIDEEVFQGTTGDTSNHKFNGWEYASSVQALTGGTDDTPSFAELLTEANLLSTVGKLDDQQAEGAEWYFTNGAWDKIRALNDGAGSKIIRLNEGYKYNLLAYPINLRAQVGTTATCARAAGFFGNMKWIYIGDRMNFTLDTSEHYRFINDQVVFRGLQRIAIAVALPTALVRIMFAAHS